MFMMPKEGQEAVVDQFADESKFFVESRLLQRDVKIILEGTSGQSNLLGTVVHPVSIHVQHILGTGGTNLLVYSTGYWKYK